MAASRDVDIFISTINQPCFSACVESIKKQTYKNYSLKVIRNVEPMNEAFNTMIKEANKDYFIQVDEDFILNQNCVEQLKLLIGKTSSNTVFLCADLFDVGRQRNVQGIKIYRTNLMKKYTFKNVTDCEMDLIRQIEADGNQWYLAKDVLGKHAPDYSPKAAFFRYKSMAEKQRFAFDVYSSDLYTLLEPYINSVDQIRLFSVLGLMAGMVSPRNVLGRERVMSYYNDVLYDNFFAYFSHYALKKVRSLAMPINEPPEVSVVMPLYDTNPSYVTKAVESILNQTYRDIEFIIVLNGAPDHLNRLIDEYKQRDKRIVVIHQPDPDLRKALNKGIDAARGVYIARQDADDISHLHRIEVQYRYMRSNPTVGFCGTDCYIIDNDSRIQRHYTGNPHDFNTIRETLKSHNCFTHGSIMAKSSLLKQHKYDYSEVSLHCEDYDLWLRLVFLLNVECVNLNLPLYSYRENEEGVTRKNFRLSQANAVSTREKYNYSFNVIKTVMCPEITEAHTPFVETFTNKILNYSDLSKLIEYTTILDELKTTMEVTGLTYNIDGLDDVNGKLSRYWEYSQSASEIPVGSTVLDAGSGFSLFPLLLAKLGHKVWSTDYSYQDIRSYQAARLGLDIINDSYTFNSMKYPDAMFDTVCCISCIEHIKNLLDLELSLKQFQRVIKSGGMLILSFDYHKQYYDYGSAGWKWSQSTRYFNWDAFISMVAAKLNQMSLIDKNVPIDTTDWSNPPINSNYTFALAAFRKV
jgi:glycosyltransferase involved in cell wall biosynthesis/SAM-dependent methyltransferase